MSNESLIREYKNGEYKDILTTESFCVSGSNSHGEKCITWKSKPRIEQERNQNWELVISEMEKRKLL